MHPVHVTVRSLGNVASRVELLEQGHRPRELTEAVRRGRLLRLRRGYYAAPDASPAQSEAVTIGGRLACSSAASTYGLWEEAGSVDRSTLHIAVPPTAARLRMDQSASGFRIHWQRNLERSECWRVSLADCLRGVVRCSSDETAVATLDTAISRGLVNRAALRHMFETEPLRSRLLAYRARPGSDSGVESLARQRLQRRGCAVRQQVALRGVGRVDMLIDDRLFVEIDGFEFHSSSQSFAHDRKRDAAFVLGGHRRLRFTAVDVLQDWNRVEQTILDVLRLP